MSEPHNNFYLSVSGVMGSGKTTFSRLLAKELGVHLFEEKVNENPYLANYYAEPHKWAFKSQLFYLKEKIGQLLKVKELLSVGSIVQDTPIYQDSLSYARAQKLLGYMNDEEYAEYLDVLHSHLPSLPMPHLIVQLDAPLHILEERIQKRARSFERSIDPSYLELLLKLQNEWLTERPELKVMRIATDNSAHDIAQNAAYQKEILENIKSAL